MKALLNDKGFSLLELIIVIGVIGLAIGMTTFGFNLIFSSNTKSYAKQFESDLRGMRNDTMYAIDKTYYMLWKYDDGSYMYTIYDSSDLLHPFEIKTVDLHADIKVSVDIGDGNGFLDLDSTYGSNPNNLKIQFEKSSGKITNIISNNNGEVKYKFTSTTTSDEMIVHVIVELGRVYSDE